MQESSHYSTRDFVVLLVCLISCVTGVYIITKRPKMLCIKENRLANFENKKPIELDNYSEIIELKEDC